MLDLHRVDDEVAVVAASSAPRMLIASSMTFENAVTI
jgi:hypothetical protein